MTKQQRASLINLLQAQGKQIFTYTELKSLFSSNRFTLRIPNKSSIRRIIDFLITNNLLGLITLQLGVRIEKRYIWNHPNVLDLAILLKPKAYFTHLTALYLNGTIDNPKIVYVNVEQAPKNRQDNSLHQANIDRAFQSQQRQSKSFFGYDGYQVRLLNGKYTGQLGVVDTLGGTGQSIDTPTSKELL